MKDLRIVFYGTPEFAVATLQALIQAGKNVVAVVTAPDRPAGRGRTLKQSDVKNYALSQNIQVLQPTNLKSGEFQSDLEALQPDLQIVVAFRMLPEAVWSLPTEGTFNLHASLLPQYRGAAPINWAIINGEKKTGVTTFFIDDKIDTGEIILQKEITIEPEDTAGSLHDKLMKLGSKAVLETVGMIENNNVKTQIQKNSEDLKTAYKLHTENTKIDWDQSISTIHNKIRGLSPYPAAWSFLINDTKEVVVKILKSTPVTDAHSLETGDITTTKKDILVAVKGGYLRIEEIQLPGKKKMDARALLNGYTFENGAKMR
tara:strand:+ start:20223 stop:21170 length:948 start_codon:yes stop_codon:yes gene_type:complete